MNLKLKFYFVKKPKIELNIIIRFSSILPFKWGHAQPYMNLCQIYGISRKVQGVNVCQFKKLQK